MQKQNKTKFMNMEIASIIEALWVVGSDFTMAHKGETPRAIGLEPMCSKLFQSSYHTKVTCFWLSSMMHVKLESGCVHTCTLKFVNWVSCLPFLVCCMDGLLLLGTTER
jgi:hypothetical protein